ncbi:thiol-disulfide oxidoreductase DCC family protein [Bacillus sp. 1P06AnD]|uniref:thiol-disulfide oxidoreductase DCC family protein n=1 Tax=Bacillus sp. 1P06AnD TaxID=3132208 RepID=UPI0039A1191A
MLNKAIVLFDGDCHVCNTSVQFILKRDPNDFFRFASLQSNIGQRLLKEHHLPEQIESLVLIDQGIAYTQSDAVFRICRHLKGIWKGAYTGIFIPRGIRNVLYQFIARNRYLFGKKPVSCPIPTEREKKAMLS